MKSAALGTALARVRAAQKQVTQARRRVEDRDRMATLARQRLSRSQAALKAAQNTLTRLKAEDKGGSPPRGVAAPRREGE